MGNGDAPHILFGGKEIDYKRLYRSPREIALIKEVTLQAGYGVLKSGTVLAENKSASGGVGKYVPYNPTTFTTSKEITGLGKAFVTAQPSGTSVQVTMEDSYKFSVGDDLILNSDGVDAENLGAITAIDRTTYTHIAVITVTATVSGAHTVANSAYVCVEAGDSSNNYSDAVGILESSVDTGEGEDSKGALATMVVKNAILYQGMLRNCDAAARTDLSASAANNLVTL